MTLALYGKTKRRQSGLMLAALMAILFAALGGVAVISSAFAHHLDPNIKSPTCQDQTWSINVDTGQWSEFREAVLTNTTGSVAMVRTPFVSNSFSTSILSASGTGAVHLAGDVTQYLGAFSSPVQIDAIDSSTTSLHASSGTFAGYLTNDVILVGTEMMKVTGIPDPTHLTVTRGFGTAASAHGAGSVSRWVRGGVDLLGTPHTVTWNLNFDPATDCGGFITISMGVCTVGAAPAWTFHLLAPNDAQSGQTLTLKYHYDGELVDAHMLTQVENGSNPTKADWLVSIPFSGHATITLDHATATGGLTWNGVQGVTNAVASSTACASTTGTVVVKKITSGSASNDTDKFGVLVKLGSTTVQTILTTDAPGLSESTPKIYSSQTAGSYTVEENNNNGYTLLGYSAGVNTNGVYTCPNSPVASTTGSASQSLAANGTIVFCIFNQKDAVVVVAPPTVEKAQDSPAIDGGRAHWTIKITNTQANNAVQNGFVVTDSGATLDSVSTAGACGALGASPFTCNVAANSVLTLHVSKPLSAATNANNTCAPRTIDNTATAALASGTPVTVKSTSTSITVPATASLACLSIKKENGANDHQYKITIHNTGPAVAVRVVDTFNQDGTTQTISSSGITGCVLASGNLSFDCTVTAAANSDTIVTVEMTAYTNSAVCPDQTVTNTVSASLGTQGTISVTSGGSLSASSTFKTTKEGCNNGTIIIKKVVSGTAASADDAFGGTLNSQTTGNPVVQTYTDLKGNNDKSYSVAPGTYFTTETSLNGYTLLGYAAGFVDGGAFCPEAPTSATASSVTQTVATGQTKVLCVYNKKDSSSVTIKATKIVCDSEADLPNFPLAGLPVSATTATAFLATHPNCKATTGWDFEWGFGQAPGVVAVIQPGSTIGLAGAGQGWNLFSGGDSATFKTATVADITGHTGADGLWVRESLKAGYLPFSDGSSANPSYSAQLGCHNDAINFDNYDSIDNPVAGGTYYCVAWNVKVRNIIVKKLMPGDSGNTTQFSVNLDSLSSFGTISASGTTASTAADNGAHVVTETVAAGYATSGWKIFNGANVSCTTEVTPAATGADNTAEVPLGSGDVTVCFSNYATTFSGVCGLPNGQFLALDAATVNGLTGYWFTPNVYGWSPNAPLGNPGAGNAFDHQWVQVEDAGTGHRMVWSLPVNTGTNTVRVFPSVDHADDGGTTGSITGEANEYTVWGSNDGINWVAQAVGGVPFDPTPGPYIADNAARDFTFPGGLLYRYIGIQVNLAANVGTDAEIDALCAGDPTPLNGKVIVHKVKDPLTNQPADASQFSGNIDGVSGTLWGPVGFNLSTAPISVTAGSHTFAETGSQNGWTPIGYTVVTNANVESVCPAPRSAYTLGDPVSVSSNQTTLICVMNTKASLVALPTIKKVNVSATEYTITITNPGGIDATNISLTDTFNPGGTTQVIVSREWTPDAGFCTIAANGLSLTCTGLKAPAGGNMVLTVHVSAYTNSATCADQIVTNTVTATFDTQGAIAITSGASNTAQHTFPTTRTDCNNGTIAVKKVRDPGASSFADGSLFNGTIDGATWGSAITFGGVTTPKSVAPGNHSVVENTPGNGWTLVGYAVFTNSSTTASCPTDIRLYTSGASAAVSTGQLTLVCVMNTKAAPPTVTPDCTNCNPLIVNTPTPTPTTPAATPTNTTVPPKATNTPVPPTATATKTTTTDVVAGEKTPGPGALSTPVAPNTGTGISGAATSFNGFLALIGIAILGSGMALMAAGRRKTRN